MPGASLPACRPESRGRCSCESWGADEIRARTDGDEKAERGPAPAQETSESAPSVGTKSRMKWASRASISFARSAAPR